MNASILVILPHNPGDVVMALLAIRRIKAENPGLEVDYLVGEECRDLVQGSPLIRRTLCIPKRALKHSWNAGDAAGVQDRLESFLADLASTHYTLSANLFQERSGGLMQAFVHADRKIGLELIDDSIFRIRSRFLEHLAAIPADRRGNGWHAVDIYVRAMSRALGGGNPRPRDRRAENATSVLPQLLRPDAAKSLVPGEYLVFHPGSAWAGKRWPESHWAGLAMRCARAGLTLVFTGAHEERIVMDRIIAGLDASARKSVVDCVGATSLAGAAWIYAHAHIVVSGDTVAMHLAAAAGVQTLSLFGASNPVETGPYGKGHVLIQTDPNPLPDLAFEKEHPGLAHLQADEVADYLLEGVLPAGFPMWETGWDDTLQAQVLRDAKRLPHPSFTRSMGLMRALDRLADRPDENSRVDGNARFEENDPAGLGHRNAGPQRTQADWLVEKLRDALDRAVSDPKSEHLAALESVERELAAETPDSLIWEAYRISVNGLSLRDLGSHLAARKVRLGQALREVALAIELPVAER